MPSALQIAVKCDDKQENNKNSNESKKNAKYLLPYKPSDIAFPKQRIPLKDLNFCDIGWSGMIRGNNAGTWAGALECPRQPQPDRPDLFDPTCISCLKKESLRAGEVVWETYANETLQKERRDMFRKWFSSHKNGVKKNNGEEEADVVVVVAADDKYLPLLRHWSCHALKNGLQPSQLVVYAYGAEVQRWAQNQGYFCIQPTLYNIDLPESIQTYHKYSLFPLFLDLLSMKKHVLFNDADLLWTANMAQKLPQLWPDVPLISALSPRENNEHLNSGVLSMRPTPELVIFIETLMSTIPVFAQRYHDGGDQLMWNHLLRHYAFRSLLWRPLPNHAIVRNGKRGFRREYTLAIHFLGDYQNDKMERIRGYKEGVEGDGKEGGMTDMVDIIGGECIKELF